MAIQATRHFLTYTGLPLDNKSLSRLIEYKKANPHSTDIEQAVRAFSLVEPIKHNHNTAANILGIFRANFAPLNLRINNHFDPAEENCTEGIFLQIWNRLDQESKDMIQWNCYVPERAKAAYRIPFEDVDISRSDYAVVTIQKERSKARVKHPCFVPIKFAKHVVESARAADRTCPFPDHESVWKKITALAKQEYKVRLVSNRCRKFFEDTAYETSLSPAIASFIMGDKTKLNATGHMPLFYSTRLRFVEEMIEAYSSSGIAELLDLSTWHPKRNRETQLSNIELIAIIKQQGKEIQQLRDSLER